MTDLKRLDEYRALVNEENRHGENSERFSLSAFFWNFCLCVGSYRILDLR